MEVSIIDPNVFLVIANALNLIYNLPQMMQTYKTKSTDDINHWFITLRIACNSIWLVYGIYINSFLMMLNNLITVVASIFIGYYKYQNRIRPTPQAEDANV